MSGKIGSYGRQIYFLLTDIEIAISGLPSGGAQGNPKGDEMSSFSDDLIQAMTEALAHAKGEGLAIVHAPMAPREVREHAKLTQAQMASMMGMSVSWL